FLFFFFQAEDGIRDFHVTGVQTCALPISLASERVAGMVKPVKALAEALLKRGVPGENLVFLNDAHPEDAVEFSAFPPHCVRGTDEAEVVDELKPLLGRDGVRVFRKNATSGLFGRDEGGLRFCE